VAELKDEEAPQSEHRFGSGSGYESTGNAPREFGVMLYFVRASERAGLSRGSCVIAMEIRFLDRRGSNPWDCGGAACSVRADFSKVPRLDSGMALARIQ
jgi:hypothetical protein